MSGVFRSENVHCLVSTIGIFSSPSIKKLPLSKVFVIMSKPDFYNQTAFFLHQGAARPIYTSLPFMQKIPSCRNAATHAVVISCRTETKQLRR